MGRINGWFDPERYDQIRTMIDTKLDADTVIEGPHDKLPQSPSSERSEERRHLCDAVIQSVLIRNGLAIKVGRAARTATPPCPVLGERRPDTIAPGREL